MAKRIGYKIMPMIDGKLMSGAGKHLGEFSLKKGDYLSMPGNGLYFSTNREYVVENYSGLADEEVLIALEFDTNDIVFGNMEDKEPELTVPSAKIIGFQYLHEGELVPLAHKKDRNNEMSML